MDDNPEFMKRFLGLVQGVKSGQLNVNIDIDDVVITVGDKKSVRIPMHLFLTSEVNNILIALGERNAN